MRKLLLNPTPLFRKLRQLSLLLSLLLALPQTAWGEEVTYSFTSTSITDGAGTATSTTGNATQNWIFKNFSITNNRIGYVISSDSLKISNIIYYDSYNGPTTVEFDLMSDFTLTGAFVSAEITYCTNKMETKTVTIAKNEGTYNSLLTNENEALGSTPTTIFLNSSHANHRNFNGNKISFHFSFTTITSGYSNQQDASFTIQSIKITTGPIEYDLKVEDTQVTAGNASNILAGTNNDGKVSYDATQNILTLNEANLTMPIQTNIDNLIIELKGENKINTNAAESTIKRISSNETLNLTIRPASTDPLGSINLANLESSSTSLVDGFNLSLGGELFDYPSLNNSSTHNSYITSLLIGGQMVAKTGSVFSSHNKISFNNASNNNVLTLSGVSSELNSNKIISGLSNLTINYDGANTITMGDTATVITSTNSNSVLTFTKASDASSLTISNTNTRSIIHGFNSINYGDGIYTSTPAPATYINTPNNGLMSALDNTKPINSLSLSSNPSYQLWVAGTQATSTTSGTGWSYDAANNKLTLTNYNKTDNDGHAFISNMANLNVYLVGTNSVGPNSQTSTDKAFYTTYTDATLTFSTDENNKGTLSASGYDTFCEGFRTVNGIYCNNGLGYYPSSREIKAKATPTIKFAKRDQTSGAELSPAEYVGASETLQTAVNSAFKAPRPEYDNHYQLFVDSTRYTYSYAPEGIVEIPLTATDPSTGKNTFGEMNILKTGTVTITCTYPGNMQNEACSASYTLKVNKADANLAYNETTSNAYIDLSGNGQWGVPNGTGATAPTLTKPTNVTGITYTSSNTNVATVSSTGDVTPIGAGEATITATLSNNDSYNDGNASYQLTVKVPATISFANATASVLNTATYTQAATTDPAGSTITYSSSNNNVRVDANGEVTIGNSFYGPVTITATLTAVPAATPQLYYVLANEPAFQATYTLNVAKNFDISSIFTDASMNYATCILSEQLTKPDGLKVYYITGTNGNTVTTQEIDYLPYGIPILLEKTAATIGSVTARTDSSSVVSGNLLQYATSDVSATGNQYILYKNEFVKATGTIPTGKCYLQITTNFPARGILGIGNDGSTAIEGIDVEATEDEEWYDLQGRRIQKPTKAGIYIVNGKKVIINNK